MKKIVKIEFVILLTIIISIFSCRKSQSNLILEERRYQNTDTILTYCDICKFDSLFEAWKYEYFTNHETLLSSDTKKCRILKQYNSLLNMGEKIIPLLINKLENEENFFSLILYDDLQSNPKLKCSYSKGGEQGRVNETIRLYKSHKKKVYFQLWSPKT